MKVQLKCVRTATNCIAMEIVFPIVGCRWKEYANIVKEAQVQYKRTDLPEGITNGTYSLDEIANAVSEVDLSLPIPEWNY